MTLSPNSFQGSISPHSSLWSPNPHACEEGEESQWTDHSSESDVPEIDIMDIGSIEEQVSGNHSLLGLISGNYCEMQVEKDNSKI